MTDIDEVLRDADPLHGRTPALSPDTVSTIAQELAMTATLDTPTTRLPDTTSTRLSDLRKARARRRRRLLAAALATGVLAVPTAAVAVGALPGSPADIFDYWRKDPVSAVDPASAVRVGTAPGPAGRTLTVLRARTAGRTCVAPIFETPASAAAALPVDFQENGSACWTGPLPREPFGRTGASVGGTAGAGQVRTFSAAAGDAARAELRLADGTVRPALLAEGHFFGWFTSDEPAKPVLTGYAADGSVLAKVPMPVLR